MSELDQLIRANRVEVFRHTLRSLALASAAASGLGAAALHGCAHTAPASRAAPEPVAVAASDPGALPLTHPGDVWTPRCAPEGGVSLAGLVLPDGTGDFLIGRRPSMEGVFVYYMAGRFCSDEPETDACGWRERLPPGDGHTVFTMRAGELSARPLSGLLPSAVTTPQEAALVVLAQGYFHLCGTEGLDAGPGSVTTTDTGFRVVAYRSSCTALSEVTLDLSRAGEVSVVEVRDVRRLDCPLMIMGRLTDGVAAPSRPAGGAVAGNYFAQAAGLEAAAVLAFERMARELAQHGAPPVLCEWARESARDEREHTDAMTSLARRYGVAPEASGSSPLPLRPLFDVALENAVEGCVRETYGAVVAHYQANQAQDATVRAALSRVADDETRHAALAWAVAEWAAARLPAPARAQLRRAQGEAIRDLERSAERVEADELVHLAGLPTPEAARSMLHGLRASVWS